MYIEETVNAHAASPATFSIIERLQNRGMPEEDVTIYLNEKYGWVLTRLEERHANTTNLETLKEIEAEMAEVREALRDEKYVFTLQGMTNERYDELVDAAIESYPYEYEEQVHPLSGQKIKNIVPNEKRDNLFNTLMIAETIARITDPSGAVDSDITVETVEAIKSQAPIDAIRLISELAGQMRMVGSWMNDVETADFTLKP